MCNCVCLLEISTILLIQLNFSHWKDFYSARCDTKKNEEICALFGLIMAFQGHLTDKEAQFC